MTSSLSSVPVERRRRSALATAVAAGMLVVIGVVPWTSPAPGVVRGFASLALAAAVFLGLVSWGLLTSVRADAAEARLDAAITATVADAGGFDCGHDHDPDEMHLTDGCSDGPGAAACTHDCATCILSAGSR